MVLCDCAVTIQRKLNPTQSPPHLDSMDRSGIFRDLCPPHAPSTLSYMSGTTSHTNNLFMSSKLKGLTVNVTVSYFSAEYKNLLLLLGT